MWCVIFALKWSPLQAKAPAEVSFVTEIMLAFLTAEQITIIGVKI